MAAGIGGRRGRQSKNKEKTEPNGCWIGDQFISTVITDKQIKRADSYPIQIESKQVNQTSEVNHIQDLMNINIYDEREYNFNPWKTKVQRELEAKEIEKKAQVNSASTDVEQKEEKIVCYL